MSQRASIVAALAAGAAVCTGAANPGFCVVAHCAKDLGACLLDPVCRGWQLCMKDCALDDLRCQTRCADLHKPTDASSEKIDQFSECVISQHHCVPQTQQTCKVPQQAERLPRSFELSTMAGKWYITRGWNTLFDCFDCQVHTFTMNASAAKPLQGALAYKVKRDLSCDAERGPGCEYLQREVYQSFAPSTDNRAHLLNHNNSATELHYADDWYVLAARHDAYALVYYCGCNDAVCGYAGAVLYTRAPRLDTLTRTDVRDIRGAIDEAGISGFTFDGLCTPSNAACSDGHEDSGMAAIHI